MPARTPAVGDLGIFHPIRFEKTMLVHDDADPQGDGDRQDIPNKDKVIHFLEEAHEVVESLCCACRRKLRLVPAVVGHVPDDVHDKQYFQRNREA